jgi:hypothetical protein
VGAGLGDFGAGRLLTAAVVPSAVTLIADGGLALRSAAIFAKSETCVLLIGANFNG